MAQVVNVVIDYERMAKAPKPVRLNFPERDGQMTVQMQTTYSGEAAGQALRQLGKDGIQFDGNLMVSTQKVRQVGGDDGVMMLSREGGVVLKVTAPEPEEAGE